MAQGEASLASRGPCRHRRVQGRRPGGNEIKGDQRRHQSGTVPVPCAQEGGDAGLCSLVRVGVKSEV